MPKIIGICGSIGSGKTLVADYLCAQHNFYKIKMASPIKDMLSAVGLTDNELEGAKKEIEIDLPAIVLTKGTFNANTRYNIDIVSPLFCHFERPVCRSLGEG